MIEKRLRKLWDQLRGKKPHYENYLEEIELTGIRGIDALRVNFNYPVSVIAGENASGKSTVLFAAACAYIVSGAGSRGFMPSTLFPDYRPKYGERKDQKPEITIDFNYSTPEGRLSMRWSRAKGWNRSFFGRKGAKQPERRVYLRTLGNLSNPSEVRSVLSLSRLNAAPREKPLTAAQIDFAHQMLPFRYSEVIDLSNGGRGKKSLLYSAQESGASYSELHMAAGERAILRLSQEIAQLNDALVLIDEIEAGLHPRVQQLLMLQLQQLALRNDLQVIVTTHSPVVIESVPLEGRIFLERDESGHVSVSPPYGDVIQDALYGRSRNVLNFLCEDNAAEGVLQGVFDSLLHKVKIRGESIRIGRNAGAEEFPMHAAAFTKFGGIENFVFVLDGDKRDKKLEKKIQEHSRVDASVLFLPGEEAPESWVWKKLNQIDSDEEAGGLGANVESLKRLINEQNSIYDSASDSQSEIIKHKLGGLSTSLKHDVYDLCRFIAYRETEKEDSDIQPLVGEIRDAISRWRTALSA